MAKQSHRAEARAMAEMPAMEERAMHEVPAMDEERPMHEALAMEEDRAMHEVSPVHDDLGFVDHDDLSHDVLADDHFGAMGNATEAVAVRIGTRHLGQVQRFRGLAESYATCGTASAADVPARIAAAASDATRLERMIYLLSWVFAVDRPGRNRPGDTRSHNYRTPTNHPIGEARWSSLPRNYWAARRTAHVRLVQPRFIPAARPRPEMRSKGN